MPIYEYECRACGHRLEAIQKFSDPQLADCPECAQPELRKLVSAAGFRLSGGGWYETDFKGSNRRNVKENDSAQAQQTAPPCGGCAGNCAAGVSSTPADTGK